MMRVKKQDMPQREVQNEGAADGKATGFLKRIDFLKLFVSLAIPLVVGVAVGTLVGPATEEVFNSIQQPPLMPPRIVFPIMWLVLYALMGIAFYLVWTADSDKKRGAFIAYFVQLALNAAWPIVFFLYARFSVAVVIILALMIAIAVCMELFVRVRPLAGKLLVPYLVWTAFATYLNISIALMN